MKCSELAFSKQARVHLRRKGIANRVLKNEVGNFFIRGILTSPEIKMQIRSKNKPTMKRNSITIEQRSYSPMRTRPQTGNQSIISRSRNSIVGGVSGNLTSNGITSG